MKITDIRATTVTVPLEAPLRHANGCHWGRFVRTIVEVETDNGMIGLGEMGGGGESAEAGVPRDEAVSGRSRPRAARRDAVPDRQPDRIALQQPHTDPRRRWSSPASIFLARRGACPSATSSAACSATACRSRRISSSDTPRRTEPAKFRTIDQLVATRAALKSRVRLHDPQAEGRRLSSRLRARMLSRARGGLSGRSLPLRSQCRLVDRAGDSLRPARSRI